MKILDAYLVPFLTGVFDREDFGYLAPSTGRIFLVEDLRHLVQSTVASVGDFGYVAPFNGRVGGRFWIPHSITGTVEDFGYLFPSITGTLMEGF